MKKIVIVSKYFYGGRLRPHGIDGSLNPFKKPMSKLLMNKLNEEFRLNNLNCEVTVNNDCINDLIDDSDIDLILVSPHIKEAVTLTLVKTENKKCYFLKESEFLNLEVSNIVNFVKNNS